YHTCATLLERELAVEPSAATHDAYERIMQVDIVPGSQATSQKALVAEAPLVGRRHEWVQLQEAWRNTCEGRPHMVILEGEAGIGKTRLAEELLAWVRRQGVITASAHCYAVEGELAYAPVASWLRADPFRMAFREFRD